MKKIKRNFYRSFLVVVVIVFLVLLDFTNAYAQNNKDTITNPKIIQPPPPYDPAYIPPTPDSIKVYNKVDTMPQFRGGINKYLRDSIRYPQEAIEKKIHGTVYIAFIIEKDGSISNIKIIQTPDTNLSNEASRLFSTMPRWTPGIQNGKPVRVQYTVPIHFNLPAASNDAMKK